MAKAKAERIIAGFVLKQINWKTGSLVWTIVLGIHEELNEAFINYSAKFSYDPEPLENQIKDMERDIKDLEDEGNGSLLGADIKSIQFHKKEINKIKDRIKKEKDEYLDIDFTATAVKIDWTGKIPAITFAVDDDLIEKLNRIKNKIEKYRVELLPLNLN